MLQVGVIYLEMSLIELVKKVEATNMYLGMYELILYLNANFWQSRNEREM